MASDSDLANRLREVLRNSDLNTTTAATVRRGLEKHFGVDLSDRKVFIREQIDLFLRTRAENPRNDDVKDEIDEEESEDAKQEENNHNESEEEDPEEEQKEVERDEEEEERDDGKRIKKKSVDEVDKDVKKRGTGFSKPCALSPQLQKFVGVSELARTEVVKKIWAYIREKNLQNPKNKRTIICDETLRALFRANSIGMFQMNKVLSKHIWPIEEYAAPVKSSQKERRSKQGREEGSDEPKHKAKQQKGGGYGFLAPLPLSDALVKFIGTDEKALSRGDVVKRMWEYIKQNDLQDPSDKRRIICDHKLKELFEVDTFHGFTVSKLLTAHFIKRE